MGNQTKRISVCVFEHLPGEQNIWADMLTRWAMQSLTSNRESHVNRLKTLLAAPASPEPDARLKWPELKDQIASHRISAAKPEARMKSQDDHFVDDSIIV